MDKNRGEKTHTTVNPVPSLATVRPSLGPRRRGERAGSPGGEVQEGAGGGDGRKEEGGGGGRESEGC
jgi:hypothetical protein